MAAALRRALPHVAPVFMFLPFALTVGAAVRWRPCLLPWLMGVHGLLDVSAGWLVYAASR